MSNGPPEADAPRVQKIWLHGLIAAFIGGVVAAVDSGLALVLIAPEHFNLGPDLTRTLIAISVFAALSGVHTAAAYLKQSPVPPGWDGNERRTEH